MSNLNGRIENNWIVTVCLIFFCIISMFSCEQEEKRLLLPAKEVSDTGLLFGYTANQLVNSLTESSTMVRQEMENCTVKYCEQVHWVSRFNALYIPAEYREYRKKLCEADLYMEIVNPVDKVTIRETPSWLPDSEPIFNLQTDSACYPADGELNPDSITFDPLETVQQREEVREMAFRAYYAAVQNIVALAKDKDKRSDVYVYAEDEHFVGFDEGADGPELVKQMFASLPGIIDKMAEIKLEGSEELLFEGVAKGDQWNSNDYGRLAALKNIYQPGGEVSSGGGVGYGEILQPDTFLV